MAEYIATQTSTGKSAGTTGYLIVNGNVYPATSGGWAKGYLPAGSYAYGRPENLASDQHNSMARGDGDHKSFKKFRVLSVAGPYKGQPLIEDARVGEPRTGIMLHYDGQYTARAPGTAGCIGYQDPSAKDALINSQRAGDSSIKVTYVKDMDEVKRLVAQRAPGVDVEKVQKPVRAGPVGRGAEVTSQNRKGKRVKLGQNDVLAGQKSLAMAHLTSPLTGGAEIAKGSSTVFVGPQQYQVARVDDPTTDGSEIADGVESVMVG
jgi:hypothetical protein